MNIFSRFGYSKDEQVEEISINEERKRPVVYDEEESGVGELSVDVYETPKEIIIEAMIAGVFEINPECIDIRPAPDRMYSRYLTAGTVQAPGAPARGPNQRSVSQPTPIFEVEFVLFSVQRYRPLALQQID